MKFIEFFGLPGVGKSTLTNELIKCMRETPGGKLFSTDNIVIMSQQQTLKSGRLPAASFSELVKNYKWIAHVLGAYVSASCSPIRALKRIKWTLDVLRFFSKCHRHNDDSGVFVRDEGFCCRGFSLALSSPRDAADVDKYFLMMPKPDAVIILYASIECIKSRVQKRAIKHGGRVAISIDDYDPFARLIESAEITLRSRGIPVLRINSEIPIKEQVFQVQKFIEQLFVKKSPQAHELPLIN